MFTSVRPQRNVWPYVTHQILLQIDQETFKVFKNYHIDNLMSFKSVRERSMLLTYPQPQTIVSMKELSLIFDSSSEKIF